jgi:lipoprotein-anchoring transpeptidase ErfK/SrfK
MRKLAYAGVVLATLCSGLPAAGDPLTNAEGHAAAATLNDGDRITILPAIVSAAAATDTDQQAAVTTDDNNRITVAPEEASAHATAETDPQAAAAVAISPPVKKPAIKPLAPTLKASIDLSKQRMTVSENGEVIHSWPISSGRAGYRTPTGTYRPQWLSRMHYSKKYDNAPMPYSVFFHNGYAIHATYATKALGRPASHGCIRLSPAHAKAFYRLVEKHGKERTRIALYGAAPAAVTAGEGARTRRDAAGPGWTKPRRRPQEYGQPYYVQPPRYVWPGDPVPVYPRQRRGYRYGY